MIEVRYEGVVVGRSAIIRELDTRGLFLGITEPMPVGTSVTLRIGDRSGADEVPGKVELVSESQELARAGMRVRFADPRAAALFGTPVEAAPEPPAPEPEPVVVVAAVNPAVASPSPAASGATPDQGAPPVAPPGGHRRIVVDASTDKARDAAAPEIQSASHSGAHAHAQGDDDSDLSAPVGGDSGRIPAPEPSAFGGAGGAKKGRRTTRRR